MMHGSHDAWHWGFGFGHWIFGVAVWLVIVIGVVLVVMWLVRAVRGPGQLKQDSALEILKRRYASGALTHEEYDERRRELEGR